LNSNFAKEKSHYTLSIIHIATCTLSSTKYSSRV
jgi:hypothetical protein